MCEVIEKNWSIASVAASYDLVPPGGAKLCDWWQERGERCGKGAVSRRRVRIRRTSASEPLFEVPLLKVIHRQRSLRPPGSETVASPCE